MIEAKDLLFEWQPNQPIINLTELSLDAGETLLVRGPSGCGKTTLLSLLSGLLPITKGTLFLDGAPLHTMNAAERDTLRANKIGVIFQQLNLLPFLSVRQNIELPWQFRKNSPKPPLSEIESLLTALNLDKKVIDKKAAQLSVGQQQRVAIARAMINKPQLILADEPTSALDEDNRTAFLETLMSLCSENQMSLVMVTHDSRFDPHFNRLLKLS